MQSGATAGRPSWLPVFRVPEQQPEVSLGSARYQSFQPFPQRPRTAGPSPLNPPTITPIVPAIKNITFAISPVWRRRFYFPDIPIRTARRMLVQHKESEYGCDTQPAIGKNAIMFSWLETGDNSTSNSPPLTRSKPIMYVCRVHKPAYWQPRTGSMHGSGGSLSLLFRMISRCIGPHVANNGEHRRITGHGSVGPSTCGSFAHFGLPDTQTCPSLCRKLAP
jgi:hypothetical protein